MIITATCWPCMGWAYATVGVIENHEDRATTARAYSNPQAWLWGDEEDWNIAMLGKATKKVAEALLIHGSPPEGWALKKNGPLVS